MKGNTKHMIQMKQIDWTSGRVPAMAVDSGCRIAATIQELEEAMKGGLSDGTIAYCKEDSSMYVLTEKADGTKAFEKISNWVDNEEVIDMFEEYTGEKPKVSIDTTKTIRTKDGEVAEEVSLDDIENMFQKQGAEK